MESMRHADDFSDNFLFADLILSQQFIETVVSENL